MDPLNKMNNTLKRGKTFNCNSLLTMTPFLDDIISFLLCELHVCIYPFICGVQNENMLLSAESIN